MSEVLESSSTRTRELILGFRAMQLVHVAARLTLLFSRIVAASGNASSAYGAAR